MSPHGSERDLSDSDCGSSDEEDEQRWKKAGTNSLTKSGYITEVKLDTSIDLIHAGDTVMQARRRGFMKKFQSPDFYIKRCNELNAKTTTWKEHKAKPADLHWWGDEAPMSESWPTPMKQNIRVMFANLGGISHENDMLDVDILMQHCANMQIDILMVTEINLNLTQGRMRKKLRDAFKRYDRHTKISLAYPKIQVNKKAQHLMGSNMIAIQGGYAGRVMWTGADKYGRWSQMTIECDKKKTMFYCAYRVCTNTPTGEGTIAAQEITAMQEDDHPNATKPRQAFMKDLEKSIVDQLRQDVTIIVGMDANSDITSAEIEKLCANTGLIQIACKKHPNLIPPRTYDRGNDRCMDIMLTSPPATDATTHTGYLPLYAMGPIDHRFPYLDLCHNAILRGYRPNPSTFTARNFTITRPKVVDKWCHLAKQYLTKAGIFKCIEALEERLSRAQSEETVDRIFAQLDKYDETRENLYKSAANKCSPTFPKWDWSPTLAKHGTILRYWNTRQRVANEYGDYGGVSIPIPNEVTADHSILTDESISANIEYAQRDFNQTRYNSKSIRRDHLNDLAERYAEERNCTKEAALKQIICAEMSRALHQRHGHIMGKTKQGIKEILVPIPHSEKVDSWLPITNPEDIHHIIMNTNRNSLLKSAHSPFAEGPLFDEVGDHANLPGADKLLDGSFDPSQLGEDFWSSQDSDIMLEFLKNLQRKTDKKGVYIKDMEWSFNTEDYKNVFSKVPERTGCGPSGLTMNFWKAACYDEDLCALNAKMIELPLKYGRPLKRWMQSIHIMLPKEVLPYAHRMRIIQKLEGDFNAAMKYTIGRQFMQHMYKHKLNSDATYGGLRNKNCHQMLLRCQVTTEYCHLMRTPMVLADVDAAGCYDRQRNALIGLVTQQNGLPRTVSECQTKTLASMNHRAQTTHGISSESMTRDSTNNFGGSGQGSGGSGPDWHCTNELAIPVYSTLVRGCHIQAIDNATYDQRVPPGADATPSEIKQWVTSFVDDNNLLQRFSADATLRDIIIEGTSAIHTWKTILQITGGDLSYIKSTIAIMAFDHNTFRLSRDGKSSGVPRIKHPDEFPDKCTFDLNNKGCTIPLQHATPTQGLKMLGVRRSMSGNFTDEFKHRCKQVETMAGQIRSAKIDQRDMLMILKLRYYPAIRWCLPITTFTKKQCDAIQRPMINAALPKLGVNRHMPRTVVFGPMRYGGMNILSLSTEQLCKHVKITISHLRAQSATSTGLHHLMSAFQLYIGCEFPFWTENPEDYPHTPAPTLSRISYLWHQLRSIGATLSVRDMWTPSSKGHNDTSLMSAFRDIQIMSQGDTEYITPSDMHELNACRLYLQVTMLSDITTDNNTTIHPWALTGERTNPTPITYPWQIKPPERCWKKWSVTITRAFINNQASTTFSKKLMHPITPPPAIVSPQLPWQQDKSSTISISQYITQLPTFYRTIMGEISIPKDEGKHLAQVLRTGNTIWSYTDGSVKDGVAAHSYLLICGRDRDESQFQGIGETTGDPKTICSLRPEHSGALAALIISAILTHKYQLPPNSGHINLGIDNITVVKRLQQDKFDTTGDDNHDVTDYDLWQESMKVIQHQSASVATMHIKAHQDDALRDNFGGVGPMPRHAHYNIAVDKLAERKRLTLIQSTVVVPPPSIKATLSIQGKYISSNTVQHIENRIEAPPLIEYLKKRNDWSDDIFSEIDWDAHEAYMLKLPYLKAIKTIKYIHDWQNTGAQKALFDKQRVEPAHDPSEYLCPLKCGCQEVKQHYLRCPIIQSSTEMKRVISSLSKWLTTSNTDPVLKTAILHCIHQWLVSDESPDMSTLHIDNEHNADQVRDAIASQSRIGWDQFFKGRFSKKWSSIQDDYFDELRQQKNHSLKPHHDGEWWASNLIKHVIYVALNAWQMRNDKLHQNKEKNSYNKDRERLLIELRKWYDREGEFYGSNHQRHFSKSYLEQKNSTNAQLQTWTRAVSSTHSYMKKQKNYLHQVPITNFVHRDDPSQS